LRKFELLNPEKVPDRKSRVGICFFAELKIWFVVAPFDVKIGPVAWAPGTCDL
jgi:hypothetical protein